MLEKCWINLARVDDEIQCHPTEGENTKNHDRHVGPIWPSQRAQKHEGPHLAFWDPMEAEGRPFGGNDGRAPHDNVAGGGGGGSSPTMGPYCGSFKGALAAVPLEGGLLV